MNEYALNKTEEQIQREIELEEEALNIGMTAYRNKTQRLREQGLETVNNYGHKLLATSIQPFAKAIFDFLEESGKSPGRMFLAAYYLAFVNPEVAALIAARVVYDGISDQRPLQTVAIEIGARLEDEVRFGSFKEQNAGLYHIVNKNLDNHPLGYNKRVRRSTLVHAANKFGVLWKSWPKRDKVIIGTKLIDLFIASVNYVEIVAVTDHNRKSCLMLTPTEKLTKLVMDHNARAELFAPFYMPMTCPPKPFTNARDGGYYHERLRKPLVKTRTKGYFTEFESGDRSKVYTAVNALQAVAWKINGPMLEVIQQVWESGMEVEGMPSRFDAPLPIKPADIDTNKFARDEWKAKAGNVYRANLRSGSKRIQTAKIIWLAERFISEESIYFPVQLDFRGRMYFLPQYLNPQGCDLAKGLLTFANGKKLGKDGAFWLAMHVANTFGNDKVSLEARAQWTYENSERIVNMANDPFSDLWWTEADKPFQFLAACIEWVGYTTDGEDYVCSLPLFVDGSCNGLQHFAAMLRDPVAGRQVNLVPQDKPADIYQTVADQVVAALRADTCDNTTVATKWVAFGIDRKTCKRPVMVLPYGGTRDAVRKYLLEHVTARIEAGEENLFGDELIKAISYLASVVWDVMGEVVVGPRAAMDWLRERDQLHLPHPCDGQRYRPNGEDRVRA